MPFLFGVLRRWKQISLIYGTVYADPWACFFSIKYWRFICSASESRLREWGLWPKRRHPVRQELLPNVLHSMIIAFKHFLIICTTVKKKFRRESNFKRKRKNKEAKFHFPISSLKILNKYEIELSCNHCSNI